MPRRQPLPTRYFFVTKRLGDDLLAALDGLPRGTGVILTDDLDRAIGRKVRMVARRRGLCLFEEEKREAVRVHDAAELRQALLGKVPLIFLSPLYSTRSHPGQKAIPAMRAASLARLAPQRIYALGGMTGKRFERLEKKGFAGWGGIDAWTRI